MYRQSNDRYNQASNMGGINPYLPLPNMQPKMHMQPFNPSIQPPLYPDPNQNLNNYDFPPNYPPPNYPPSQNYQRSYPPSWREISEPKGPMMSNSMLSQPPIHNLPNLSMHYDVRNLSSNNDFQSKSAAQSYVTSGSQPSQMNIVLRLSGIIKSQLSVLQGIMRYTQKKSNQEKQRKERSRSRSRQRRERPRQRQHREWNCIKCSFLNFDFRDRCKRCNEPKQQGGRERSEGGVGGGKNYIPGPDDWRCLKCSNINYARRLECHRCHTLRPK